MIFLAGFARSFSACHFSLSDDEQMARLRPPRATRLGSIVTGSLRCMVDSCLKFRGTGVKHFSGKQLARSSNLLGLALSILI